MIVIIWCCHLRIDILAGLRRDAAKRIVMAASRLLGAAAACEILLSFAAGSRKQYWLHQGCDSDLSADRLNFGASNFPFKSPFEKCFKIVFFFALASRSGFGDAISNVVARSTQFLQIAL